MKKQIIHCQELKKENKRHNSYYMQEMLKKIIGEREDYKLQNSWDEENVMLEHTCGKREQRHPVLSR